MATAYTASVRPSSSRRSRLNNDEENTRYKCECGQKFLNQIDLEQHQSNNCKNQSIQCVFCQKMQASTSALRDHLMSCGNKTDECPKCHKFIRRAIFAYHYENNCVNLEETDTPLSRSRPTSAHRPSSASNKRILQKHALTNNDQANDSGYNSLNYKPKQLEDRISSSTSYKNSSSDTVKCKFCNNQFEPADYETHEKNCLEKPIDLNKQLKRITLSSNKTDFRSSMNSHHNSPDIVYIPCEFCNEQIDIGSWSTHTQDCRERENRRIQARAEAISRESIPEKIPCEYCKELFPLQQLQIHEIICRTKPHDVAHEPKLVNTQSAATSAILNNTSKIERDSMSVPRYPSLRPSSISTHNQSQQYQGINDQEHNTTLENERFSSHTSLNNRHIQESLKLRENKISSLAIHRQQPQENDTVLENERFSSHTSLNNRHIQEILKLRENNISSLTIYGQSSSKLRRASNDLGSQLINSSGDIPADDTLHGSSRGRQLTSTQSLPNRSRSAAPYNRQRENPRPMPRRAASPNVHSSSRLSLKHQDLTDARGSHRSSGTKPIKQNVSEVIFYSPRGEDQNYQPILKQPDHRAPTNNKKPRARPGNDGRPAWK